MSSSNCEISTQNRSIHFQLYKMGCSQSRSFFCFYYQTEQVSLSKYRESFPQQIKMNKQCFLFKNSFVLANIFIYIFFFQMIRKFLSTLPSSHVKLTERGSAAIIQINRPEALNAFSISMLK